MGAAILTRDKEGVVSVWKMHGKPLFSLWDNAKYPAFSCVDDDENDREKMLNEYLQIIQDSGTTADYTIKFHEEPPTGRKINNTTPVCGAVAFKLNSYTGMERSGGGNNNSAQLLNELFATKVQMMEDKWERRLQDLEREHEEELEELQEDAQTKKGGKHLGAIGMLGEAGETYPWMQEPIKEFVSFFTEKIKDLATVATHKFMNKTAPSGGIGKIPGIAADAMPDVKMKAALDTLIKYNVKRFGWPEGYTPEDIAAAGPEDKEKAYVQGFTQFADTLLKLTELCNDDDIYDLAMKKLHQL